ncbi:MAG: 16S rRNA (guanine(527)-N(7))-methyltransferase RsmG [Prevotella sp.]|nr:16S rRNA (guanine(527)-N(7))-methyltransferase RsmG [Bacteroides sp.]MCM1365915.1 16S rRNA (guanine(527)-N(7))-methyltransferase RsmG [Prevotella sp.]
MSNITKYFPNLTPKQSQQFEILMSQYPQWNNNINVISRKDIDNLEVNHILHSLAIAKYIYFTPQSKIMDFGCGGGLPGIPLAIIFPESEFTLIDRTAKKIKVAQEIASAAGLSNVKFIHGDVAECKDKFDFIVSRAVMSQADLLKISRKNISTEQKNSIPNGVIALKGGDLEAELKNLKRQSEIVPVSQFFEEPFFKTKKIVYTQI